MTKEHPRPRRPSPVAPPERRPLHHSPLFWVGAAMFIAAIAIYLWSEDLSRLPWG